jgi:hypothetical protein
MPHADLSVFGGRLEARHVAKLLTVQDLANLVVDRGRVPVA